MRESGGGSCPAGAGGFGRTFFEVLMQIARCAFSSFGRRMAPLLAEASLGGEEKMARAGSCGVSQATNNS